MNKVDQIRTVADIKDLIRENHEAQGNLCHWEVTYSVKIPDLTLEEIKELGLEDETDNPTSIINPWATDEMIIQGGSDAQEVIDWLKTYVNDPEQYGIPVIGFRLTSINLLSEADAVVE